MRGVGSHPQGSGLVVRRAQAVADDLCRGATAEQIRDLLHRGIHDIPQLIVARPGRQGDAGASNAVLIGSRIKLDPAQVSGQVGRIGRLHLADAANGNRNIGVGRRPQLVKEVHVGESSEQFILCANRAAAAGRRDLQVKTSEQIASCAGTAAFDGEAPPFAPR